MELRPPLPSGIIIKRADLDQVMMGTSTFDDLIKSGKAKFTGDRKPFDQLRSILVVFAPNFEILPGTAARPTAAKPTEEPNPFKVPE